MSSQKPVKPKARLPRGFRDRGAAEIMAEQKMLATIRGVYESYGFDPLETPAFEYTDALGKFLPDVDRPNEGVFSLKDDDEQWMSLRYDLTAPLARHVAANFQHLAKPFRRYQVGSVWRNEKPGPGRYREFTQFDADTVGSASASADAELLMMLSDTLEALGLKRGDYIVKLNNRKLLDGVLEASGVALEDRVRRGIVLRAIDKIDRLGVEGVSALLGEGRKDASGDFTKGAGLTADQAHRILAFVAPDAADEDAHLRQIGTLVGSSAVGAAGLNELEQIVRLLQACGYGPDRVLFDTSVVRGLDYYTGAVFEAQLTFPIQNEAGEEVVQGTKLGFLVVAEFLDGFGTVAMVRDIMDDGGVDGKGHEPSRIGLQRQIDDIERDLRAAGESALVADVHGGGSLANDYGVGSPMRTFFRASISASRVVWEG